jgi:hypothetical protein
MRTILNYNVLTYEKYTGRFCFKPKYSQKKLRLSKFFLLFCSNDFPSMYLSHTCKSGVKLESVHQLQGPDYLDLMLGSSLNLGTHKI